MDPQITNDNSHLPLPNWSGQESGEAEAQAAVLQSIADAPHNDSCLQLIAEAGSLDNGLRPYLRASLADSSKRAYAGDIAHFLESGGAMPATAEVVACYLAQQGGKLSPFTLARRLVAIGKAHRAQGHANPCDSELVHSVLRGIRRVHGTAQRQVDPLLKEDLLAIIDTLPADLNGVRDRALLLIGFAAALRRSELTSLTVEDVTFVPEGLILRLRRSKTDQEAKGRNIGIPFARSRACPVKALRAWLDRTGITAGPLFRGVGKGGRVQASAMASQSVALVIKLHAGRVGLDPQRLSGHSLRAGLITSAAKAGVSSWKIRAQSGHRSDAMLARYVRDGEMFVMNAAGAVL